MKCNSESDQLATPIRRCFLTTHIDTWQYKRILPKTNTNGNTINTKLQFLGLETVVAPVNSFGCVCLQPIGYNPVWYWFPKKQIIYKTQLGVIGRVKSLKYLTDAIFHPISDQTSKICVYWSKDSAFLVIRMATLATLPFWFF